MGLKNPSIKLNIKLPFPITAAKNKALSLLKICFYRGIQAEEEMRTSFLQHQKQILSGTPYALS